ncbi:MAG: cytoplasmic protein [Deltaproteobacteria bacterium]|nr:cytoplasmic protein [Deltaproteobacteria bacterium]MBF0509112.1 cytoplasmic protein [Deltaproteobacteria bacterium]
MEQIPDVLQAAGDVYKLLMENDQVRVLEVRLKPDEKAPMHNHPNNHVVSVINDAKFRLTLPDGQTVEFDAKAGQTLWIEAGSHAAENIGTTNGHNVLVELKR